MKRAVFALLALVMISCKPQKPWSPYDDSGTLIPNEKHVDSHASALTVNEQFNADIGDVEQQVFISGIITGESRKPNVDVQEKIDARDNKLLTTVTITNPEPGQQLWAEYKIRCGRNFMTSPAVVRARVASDDKVAGSFAVALGTKAMSNGFSIKLDLLKPFNDQIPDSFLYKVVGDLYLTDDGTDEFEVNPETVTTSRHSEAIRATMMRVHVVRNAAVATPVPADAVTSDGSTPPAPADMPATVAAPPADVPATPPTGTPVETTPAPQASASSAQ